MVEFNSERFGEIEYDEAEVIRFAQGVVGFPDMTRFFLYADPEVAPLAWLHSIDDPNLAFLVVDPFLFFPQFEVKVKLPPPLRAQIGQGNDLRVLCIVTIQSNFARSTVNLLGPIVVNARLKNGWQIILDDDSLSTRQPLFPDAYDAAEEAEAS